MRTTIRVVSVLAASLAIAACSAGSTPAPTAAPRATTAAAASQSAAAKMPLVLPPAEVTNLKIGLSNSVAVNQFPAVVARDLGLFQRYGLNVEVISMSGGSGDVTRSLISNAIQVGLTGAGPALSAALTDAPLSVSGMTSLELDYSLIGGKDIKTAADLKGKGVAISTLGDTAHAVVLAALEKLGLKTSDVLIQTIGNEQGRNAAILAGAVAAGPVQNATVAKLKSQGLNVLIDIKVSKIRFGLAGITTTKEWAAKYPNTLLRVTAALLDAQKAIATKPALVTPMYQNFTSLDAETSKASVEACIATVCNMGLRFTADDLKLNKDVLVSISPEVAKVDINTIVNLAPLDKLKELGFNDEIQFP